LILGTSGKAGSFDAFTIDRVKGGKCEISADDAKQWQSAKEGATHPSGTWGRTDGDSSFTVKFDKDNHFRMLQSTQAKISTETLSAGFQKVTLDLSKGGSVSVTLDNFKGHQFKVQTPTAVCGAVGTRFDVQAEGNQNHFECSKGSIDAESNEGRFEVARIEAGRGLSATVEPGKENSYTQLKAEGGSVDAKVAGQDFEVAEKSSVALAREKGSNDQGAIQAGGRTYVIDGGETHDVTKDGKASGLVQNYVSATRNESDASNELRKASEEGVSEDRLAKLKDKLDRKAEEASKIRKELFSREILRDTIRRNMDIGRSRPTPMPR